MPFCLYVFLTVCSSLYVRLPVYLPFCMVIRLPVYLLLCTFVCLRINMFAFRCSDVCLLIRLQVSLYAWPSSSLFASLFVYLLVCLLVCITVCLAVCQQVDLPIRRNARLFVLFSKCMSQFPLSVSLSADPRVSRPVILFIRRSSSCVLVSQSFRLSGCLTSYLFVCLYACVSV